MNTKESPPNSSQSETLSVDEILNCSWDYEPLDLPTAVPLIYQTVTNKESTISIDDLNMLQEQLEKLATDAAKRLRLLKNQVKIIDPEQLEEFEENLRQLKIANYEKYQQQQHQQQQLQNIQQGLEVAISNTQNQTPKVDMIDNMLKSQITTMYEDAIPTRFWNYVQTFDLNESNLKPLADYLAGNIPFRHVGNKKYGDQSNKSEYKELFEAALKNQVSNVSKLRRQHNRTKIGPYTKRLMASIIDIGSDKTREQVKEWKAFISKNRPTTQTQANIIEKSVLNELQYHDFVSISSQQESSKKCTGKSDTLSKLERRLDSLSNSNQARMKVLAYIVKYELVKKRMQEPVKSLQVDLIKAFKNILLEEQQNEARKPKNNSNRRFEEALDRKTRLISFLKSMNL